MLRNSRKINQLENYFTICQKQKIRAKIAAKNTSTQESLTNQAGPSNQQASTTQNNDNEIVPPTPESLLPPPGFE